MTSKSFNEKLLLEFIEWARNCGENVFYIFDESEESIKRFLKQRDGGKG
jgi:hypothetical protein